MKREDAQRHRLNRVLNVIQSRYDAPLNLDALSGIACLSKHHFARAFRARHRQSPAQFVWRVRLERAARKLAFDRDADVTGIALDCGFASLQSFSGAFRERFGVAPSAFRATNDWPSLTARKSARRSPARIERKPARRVAYIRHFGPYRRGEGGIADAFTRLEIWARAHGVLDDTPEFIGLCPDNRRVTPESFRIYDACVTVTPDVSEDDIVSLQTIPAGAYAVAPFDGSPTQVLAAWETLCGDSLRAKNQKYEPRWSYETFTSPRSGKPTELHLRLASPGEDRGAWDPGAVSAASAL